MKTRIRRPEIKDAKAMSLVVRQAITKVNSADYTPRQVRAWSLHNSEKRLKERIAQGRIFFVLSNSRSILGVASMRVSKKHITALFIGPKDIRKGYGKRLLKYMERYAKKKGLSYLSVNSSKTAFPFYEKMGYKMIRKFSPRIHNVEIPSVMMKKKLK